MACGAASPGLSTLQRPYCKKVRVLLMTLTRAPLEPASAAVSGTAAHAPGEPGEADVDGSAGALGDVDGSGVAGALPVREAVPLRVGENDGVLLRVPTPTGVAVRVGVTVLLGVSDCTPLLPLEPGAV